MRVVRLVSLKKDRLQEFWIVRKLIENWLGRSDDKNVTGDYQEVLILNNYHKHNRKILVSV
jgi:hypothetical protein